MTKTNWENEFDEIYKDNPLSSLRVARLKILVSDTLKKQKADIIDEIKNVMDKNISIHKQLSKEIVGKDHHKEFVRLLEMEKSDMLTIIEEA